jgi:hypothetical protein
MVPRSAYRNELARYDQAGLAASGAQIAAISVPLTSGVADGTAETSGAKSGLPGCERRGRGDGGVTGGSGVPGCERRGRGGSAAGGAIRDRGAGSARHSLRRIEADLTL